MILWAKASSLGTPNDQRVHVIKTVGFRIHVELCTDPNKILILKPEDICGVELGNKTDHMSIFFNGADLKTHKYFNQPTPFPPFPKGEQNGS